MLLDVDQRLLTSGSEFRATAKSGCATSTKFVHLPALGAVIPRKADLGLRAVIRALPVAVGISVKWHLGIR
jgi:hypothetical protein